MGIRKQTKYLTVSAMLAALGVIILSLGALIEVVDLTTAVFASMLCIYAVIEMGGFYPVSIWLATSVLGLLLLPQKSPAIFYTLFFGFYPILKEKFEKRSRVISSVCKLVTFHVCILLIAGTFLLFLPDIWEQTEGLWFYAVLYLMSLVCFWLYDVALSRLITFYLLRLRNRFRIR